MTKTRPRGVVAAPSNLKWPETLRHTALRRKWFERLQTLPPGLNITEVTKRLKVRYGLAIFWATTFKYPFVRFRRDPKPASTGVPKWASKVDWTLPDREISELIGLTRQRVNQVRMHAAKRPTNNSRPEELREHLKGLDKRTSLSLAQIEEIAERFGMKPRHARKLIHEAGIPVARRRKVGRWTTLDWSLPNKDLAEIYGANVEAIYMARRRLNAQNPRWKRPAPNDPAYRVALSKERRNASPSSKKRLSSKVDSGS